MPAAGVRLLFVTAPAQEAPALVRTLVEARLAACGNILEGARSIYRWEGQICDETEAVIWLETTPERVAAAMARIRAEHSYDCPKIVVLAPEQVDVAYGAFVEQMTRAEDSSAPASTTESR